jgi:hypothetical protein
MRGVRLGTTIANATRITKENPTMYADLYQPHARQLRKPSRPRILNAEAKHYPGHGALALASMTANSVRLLRPESIAIQYVRSAPYVSGRSVTINGKESISATIPTDDPGIFYRVKSASPHHIDRAEITAIVVKGR